MSDLTDAVTALSAKVDALSAQDDVVVSHLTTFGVDFRAGLTALTSAVAGNPDPSLAAAVTQLQALGGKIDAATTAAQSFSNTVDGLDAAIKAATAPPAPASSGTSTGSTDTGSSTTSSASPAASAQSSTSTIAGAAPAASAS